MKHVMVGLNSTRIKHRVFLISSRRLGWSLGSIITGTNVTIVWDSSQNTASQSYSNKAVPVRVSIPTPKNVPNNGLLHPSTNRDWDGGLNTSMPTPGTIYGFAVLFTLNSTSNAAASVTVIATHFVACCTGGSSNARRSGIIAGSVLGGVIALGFLATLRWWATKKTVRITI